MRRMRTWRFSSFFGMLIFTQPIVAYFMSKLNTTKTTWDLSLTLPSDDRKAVEKEKKAIVRGTQQFVKKWKRRSDYLKETSALVSVLKEYERWSRKYGHGGASLFYFQLRAATDQSNSELKGRQDQLMEFAVLQWKEMRFFVHNLSRISKTQQKKFLADARLRPYHSYLRTLFAWAPYRLSEEGENILNLLNGPSHAHWTRMRSDFISRDERTVLTNEGRSVRETLEPILSLVNSPKKRVRDRAAAG